MMQKLREYQKFAISAVVQALKENPKAKIPVVMPTGTGKTLTQLALAEGFRKNYPGIIIHFITTRIIVILTYLKELGIQCNGKSHRELKKIAEANGIFTYQRYANLLKTGLKPANLLIFDEMHHAKASNKGIAGVLTSSFSSAVIGFTATFFRATPKATRELREEWGQPIEPISIETAKSLGYWHLPQIIVRGTVDDDLIKVSNGKFVMTSMEKEFGLKAKTIYTSALEQLREARKRLGAFAPAILAVPSVEIAKNITDFFVNAGVPTRYITAETPDNERKEILEELKAGKIVLAQVKIVSEGFDMPELQILIDLKPMLSPVEFLQFFGRSTRPSKKEKLYICLNRNIERHLYLIAGVVPNSEKVDALKAFENPSKRGAKGRLGVENLGKFKPIDFYRSDGTTGSLYVIQAMTESHKQQQFAAVLLPDKQEPLCCVKENVINTFGEMTYGKWKRCPMPKEGFTGYASIKKYPNMTPKQAKWWDKSRARHGLADYTPNGKEFAILPILVQAGVKV